MDCPAGRRGGRAGQCAGRAAGLAAPAPAAPARQELIAAFTRARDSGDTAGMIAVALRLPSVLEFGAPPGQVPVLIHEAYATAGEPGGPRAWLAAALARAWVYGGDPSRAVPFAAEALELAEQAADPAVLADALDAALATRWGPDDFAARLALAARLANVAAAPDHAGRPAVGESVAADHGLGVPGHRGRAAATAQPTSTTRSVARDREQPPARVAQRWPPPRPPAAGRAGSAAAQPASPTTRSRIAWPRTGRGGRATHRRSTRRRQASRSTARATGSPRCPRRRPVPRETARAPRQQRDRQVDQRRITGPERRLGARHHDGRPPPA